MVLEELQILVGAEPLVHVDETTKKVTVNRALLPASGPIIINDVTGLPWSPNEYRRKWRLVATAAGVPKNVWNMDSRSGAISEAIQAGAPIEFVQHGRHAQRCVADCRLRPHPGRGHRRGHEDAMESRNKPKPGND
jgi:hypothetical protein